MRWDAESGREGALAIPGERPAGVFTAGVAQAYMNLYNRMPARNAVILGSGDIGMIMARRLTLEGANVRAVLEIQPYPAGLARNVEQCLHDFGIPLILGHTVTQICGGSRLEGVVVSAVGGNLKPVPGTQEYWPCETLILSVGLIPENELSLDAGVILDERTKGPVVNEFFETSVPAVFAAGNVLHVHDLVDYVSLESEQMAEAVCRLLEEGRLPECPVRIVCGNGIAHTVPMAVSGENAFELSLRVGRPGEDVRIAVVQEGREIAAKKFRRAVPAEMIRLSVDGRGIRKDRDLEVVIQ